MVHKALGAEYSASAIIETFFGFPNVPDGTDFNLECKIIIKILGGGGGGQAPRTP